PQRRVDGRPCRIRIDGPQHTAGRPPAQRSRRGDGLHRARRARAGKCRCMSHRPPARLVLADGRTFEGEAIGARGRATGEVVFNTSMTGYQEALTGPSYGGQILAMTYP